MHVYADYIAASLLTDNEMKSIDATAKLAGEKNITNSNMVVSDNNAVAKLSGATDINIENKATYVDTGTKGQTKSNADATADMINTINNGGVLVARVGDTPGKPVGHSIVFSGYSVDSNGNVAIKVIDPAGKYDHYDPETKKLYYIDEKKVRQDDSRKMINYLHVTKK
jgi:hypothetical protein